jgi:two-component system chemotaxis response regulator CheY
MTRQLRFLVVDDEPTSRLTLKKLFEGYGEVDEAEGGVEAVMLFRKAVAEKTPYHLITLDMNMPTMDGLTVLECMRGLEVVHRSLPKVKVLMATGESQPEMIKGTIRLGTEGYLLKPLDLVLLEAKVRGIFNMPLTVEQKGKLSSGSKRRPTPVTV